jgi:hypothetical protein
MIDFCSSKCKVVATNSALGMLYPVTYDVEVLVNKSKACSRTSCDYQNMIAFCGAEGSSKYVLLGNVAGSV